MDLIAFVAATAAVIVGAIVQATTGVGGGFLIVPLLAIIDLSLVPSPLIFASLSLSLMMAIRERTSIDWQHIPLILAGMLPGAIIGAYFISRMPSENLGLLFGPVILLGVLITVIGRPVPLSPYSAVTTGAVCGVMGASSGIGAPMLALLYQHESGPRLRGTLAVIYITASLLILAVLAGFNQFWTQDIITGTYLIPGFIIGYLVASRFTERIDHGKSRIAVLIVSAAAAGALIWRSFPDEWL